MTLSENPAGLSPFVVSLTAWVQQRTIRYAEEIEKYLKTGGPPGESALLDSFSSYVEDVVDQYNPPGIRRTKSSLVFAHLYSAARAPDPAAGTPRTQLLALIAALLAAEVEFGGPLRLSRSQNESLADTYEWLGKRLRETGLPAHANRAFRRARGLYRQIEDLDAEDRCALAQARAQRQAMASRWKRAGAGLTDLLCGYGYEPFRMLGWIAIQLLIFTLLVQMIAPGDSWSTTVYECLTDYLNPLGNSDTSPHRHGGAAIFVVESYAGTVSMSVFFALLVRRWFRL